MFFAASQTTVSNNTTYGKFVSIVPKAADNKLTRFHACFVSQQTPSHSQPTNGRMEIDSYDQKKTHQQFSRESGSEALSALERLSASIGMEKDLLDQSLSA